MNRNAPNQFSLPSFITADADYTYVAEKRQSALPQIDTKMMKNDKCNWKIKLNLTSEN